MKASFPKSLMIALTTLCLIACSQNKEEQEDSNFTQFPSLPNTPGNPGVSPPQDPDNGDQESPVEDCTVVAGVTEPGNILINNGASFTASQTLDLQIARSESLRMKISNSDNCSCGTWENYTETKVWNLPTANETSVISVQFRDYEGRYSICAKASITHDDQAPMIGISLETSNTYLGDENTKLNLHIQDTGAGLKSISCKLNNRENACESGTSTLVFERQQPGNYIFEVSAVDQLGHTKSESVSWVIQKPYHQIIQVHEVKSNNKVDILIVADNSSSMAHEQYRMASRMRTFLDQLDGLKWKIAITTTDPRPEAIGGDGQLVEMKGSHKKTHITSEMDKEEAQQILGEAIQREEKGSSFEQGIYATYRALERALDPKDNENKKFIGNSANFAAIVISDEDETIKGPKNQPENLLNFVQNNFPKKNFAFHSIITRPGDTKCKGTYGSEYGFTYEKMSLLTGANMLGGPIIGSVCADDYGSQLKGIGESVQAMQKIIVLDCAPVGNANSSVLVLLDGNNYTAPYSVEGDRILFESNLPAGKYTLQYRCQ